MDEFEINDLRSENQFKGITFSKFKRTDAKKELLNSLSNGKIEYALNWSAEYICCGCFIELWDIILNFVGKHIHIGNPKLPIYLELRFNNFREIISNYTGFEINMRNNDKVRKIFAEIITVICNSKKKHSIESIKIKKQDEFDMTTMSSRLKAPSINYASEIFKKDDPKELFIAINELAYHLSKDSFNSLEACYWIEWILEFENLCKKRKDLCICERRTFVKVDEKFQKEPVWIIWDIIFYLNSKNKSKISTKILKSIFELFCIRYTSGSKRKRKYLIYFAVSVITEKFDDKINIIENKDLVDNITKKINLTYKEIKKNEEKPATDYLFNGIQKTNTEKTIEKLNTLNEMNTIIRT
tara:strand:- start:520 stop:1587 length:1068 start_codon:yes stop_codon:yes gene_type:complete